MKPEHLYLTFFVCSVLKIRKPLCFLSSDFSSLSFFVLLQVRSIVHSSRSSVTSASGVSVNSASSMDSLDSVLRTSDTDSQHSSVAPSSGASQGQHNTEVSADF